LTADWYLGIDPGKKGAWAWMRGVDGKPLKVGTLPYLGDRIDVVALMRTWQSELGIGLGRSAQFDAAIEYPLAVQAQSGGEKAFINFGSLLTTATLCGASLHLPRPHIWKGKMRLSKDKSLSVRMCVDLWPETYDWVHGPRGGLLDGIAEAMLLAEWRRRADRRIRTPEPALGAPREDSDLLAWGTS
jgi:hypothetical protein